MQLLNYEDFKNFTLSPAYSLICMTSLTKTIVHIYGPWAISVPPYDMCPLYRYWDIPHTHKLVNGPNRGLHCLPLCIKPLTRTYTITSPIVFQLETHCSHCIYQSGTSFFCNSPQLESYTCADIHTHAHPHRFLMLIASEPKRFWITGCSYWSNIECIRKLGLWTNGHVN